MAATVRIAAAADIHCSEPLRERITHAFGVVEEQADLVLLAGDLTTHGEPEQAAVLADACRGSRSRSTPSSGTTTTMRTAAGSSSSCSATPAFAS